MEILDYRVLLPAFVTISDIVKIGSEYTSEIVEEARKHNMFVYIDHANRDVILVDVDGWLGDREELRKVIYNHIMSKRTPSFVPPAPSEGFTKLKPETYVNK